MTTANLRFVLVNPTHPGNVGAAARAIKNMGFADLWIVAPEIWPDPQAQWRAAGAQDVLAAAHVVATLDEAIADCVLVTATSVRDRRLPWPLADVRAAAPGLRAQALAGPVAVLFGREATGLTNDELQRCNLHLRIPTGPDYPSLNVASAVQVVAYELLLAGEGVALVPEWDRPPATADAVERLVDHLAAVLERLAFHPEGQPGQVVARLRRLLLRVRLDDVETGILRGILKEVDRVIDAAATPAAGPDDPAVDAARPSG